MTTNNYRKLHGLPMLRRKNMVIARERYLRYMHSSRFVLNAIYNNEGRFVTLGSDVNILTPNELRKIMDFELPVVEVPD